MTRDTLSLPNTRTWRDIPQPVVPRAMSRGGRWRLVMASVRVIAVTTILGATAWGAWLVFGSLREDPRVMPQAAKATPMKKPELHTDGVLDEAWLAQALHLPKNASLMELDLQQLRARLLADDQVVSANLTRHFPDRLVVQITERSPVARVMTEWLGQQRELLVSRDGTVFSGTGYDRAVLDTLPWLDGISITPQGGRFRPIPGMDAVAELLAKARLEAEHLYASWEIVSLARLDHDHKIEVRTKAKEGTDGVVTVYFSTHDDFFRQLVKLNYVWEQLASKPFARATVDLTLGQDVPVATVPLAPATPVTNDGRSMLAHDTGMNATTNTSRPAELRLGGMASPRTEPALFVLQHSQSKKTKREL